MPLLQAAMLSSTSQPASHTPTCALCVLFLLCTCQVLLGVIIDSVWPPSQSAEACAKGAVAKYIVEQQALQVQEALQDKEADLQDLMITVGGPPTGAYQKGTWLGLVR